MTLQEAIAIIDPIEQSERNTSGSRYVFADALKLASDILKGLVNQQLADNSFIELQTTATTLQQQVIDLTRDLDTKTTEAENHLSVITEKDTEIENLNNIITTKDTEKTELNKIIIEKDTEIDRLSKLIPTVDQEPIIVDPV